MNHVNPEADHANRICHEAPSLHKTDTKLSDNSRQQLETTEKNGNANSLTG